MRSSSAGVNDCDGRRCLADAMDEYLKGGSGAAQLDEKLVEYRDRDLVCREIAGAMDLFIDDFVDHRNAGKYKLTEASSAMIARWVLFLRSEVNWKWGGVASDRGFLRNLLDCLRPSRHPCLTNEYWPMSSMAEWKEYFPEAL